MLYVFHVDTGTMMTFDMNLAMENVSVLQSYIARMCHITEDKQVLLISGGESLDPSQRVAKYSAGTDTNPIYLFSKTTIEAATPPSPSIHYGSDIDLQGQVEGSLLMPPAYDTVVSRTQLAVQFRDVDDEEMKACERLVHDQHLQQQGWAAVVANLEDITSALRQRWEMFQEAYRTYMSDRQGYLNTLESIGVSLELLSKIPLLPCLGASLGLALSYPVESNTETSPDISATSQGATLFQWISSQDPQHSLHDMVEQCLKATEQFDEKILETLGSEVTSTIEAVDNASMKEVKGLEDRLYGLDQFMSGARKLVQEQADMAKGFVQNQNRVSNLRDNSILPDLCASHKKQLVVMLTNHKKLRDIKKKCRMAKEELSINLHTRLRWVMFVEKKICDVDGKLMIYRENLKRLQKRLDILHQIHDAPRVYADLVVEVVRRRKFSSLFLEWATSLAMESSQLHSEEVKRRQAFLSELGKHFLQSLFQGFEDSPPLFATEAPTEFDQRLPPITDEDITMLRESVPELADKLSVPSVTSAVEKMTLHTMMSSVSDSTVQCEAMVCRSIPGAIGTSAATSDIDIIQSQGDHQFVHIENSNLSLKDQVAACEPHTDIKIKPQVSVIADKPIFPVPQSLSETLTQEMRAQAKAKEDSVTIANVTKSAKGSQSADGIKYVKMSDSADGLQSSGEPTKSSDSDVGSADRSRESLPGKRHHGKSHLMPDTSPEMETSQEFQTADFYIDESMPSSMTDSPPNKHSSGGKVSISQQLVEKSQSVAKLEKELTENQKKLTTSQKYVNALKDMVNTDVPKLREMLTQLRESVASDKETMNQCVDSLVKSVVGNLSTFHENLCRENEEAVIAMKNEHEKSLINMKQELDGVAKSKNDLLKEVSFIKTKLETAVTDLSKFKVDAELKCQAMVEGHEEEKADLVKRHTLELEVELDRTQADYRQELDQQEVSVKQLTDQLTQAESRLNKLVADKERELEEMKAKYEKQSQELRGTLEKEFKVKEDERVEEAKKEAARLSDDKVEQIYQEYEKKLSEETKRLCLEKEKALLDQKDELDIISKTHISELTEKMNKERTEELKQLGEQLEKEQGERVASLAKEHGERVTSLEKEHNEKVASLEKSHGERMASLEKDHGEKIASLQQAFMIERTELEQHVKQLERSEMSSTESQTEDGSVMSLSQHRQELQDKDTQLREDMEKALSTLREEHDQEMKNLVQTLEKQKEDSLKTSIAAERQVQFNEAVSRVSQEKDKVIEEVKQQLQEQSAKLVNASEERERLEKEVEEMRSQLEEKEQHHGKEERQHQDEMALLKQTLSQLQQQILTKSETSVSAPDVKEGPSLITIDSRTSELETTLKTKEEEINKLQQRVMELSMTASTRSIAQDKVSITSCVVGDLVLLCLDERHDQYVVFTIGTTLHFLHTECLDSLGLRTGPDDARKSWVLAEIVDKEYCQAKKPQNRFKVPVGTKFYRVKAKPWSRETTRKDSASPSKSSQASAAV